MPHRNEDRCHAGESESWGVGMERDAGALVGVATARHDPWRLSHLAIHLREGNALLHEFASSADYRSARKVAKSLQRQLRRALVLERSTPMIKVGVAQPLRDLLLDWTDTGHERV